MTRRKKRYVDLGVTVAELERRARESHSKPLLQAIAPSDELEHLAQMLFFDPVAAVQSFKKDFPGQVIKVCEMGCGAGIAAKQLERKAKRVKVASFGVDTHPLLHPRGLSGERLFEADLNDMACVPDGSFHVMFGHNLNTDVTRFIPEMDRVLVPHGIAFFDVENLLFKLRDMTSLPQKHQLMVHRQALGENPAYDGPLREVIGGLLSSIEGGEIGLPELFVNLDVINFRLIKPVKKSNTPP